MKKRPRLDPDPETMRRFGYQAIDRLVEHYRTLSEQPVVSPAPGPELRSLVREPIPRSGRGFEDTLEFYFERVVPRMTRVNHPRFHAYIPCPGSFFANMGELLASGTNPFVGSWLGGATHAALELEVLDWIAQAIGFEAREGVEIGGIFTSGGSMANLGGVACAREHHGHRTLENGTVYCSTQGHESFEKAARVLGYRQEQIRRLPAKAPGVMSLDSLEQAVAADRADGLRPFLVCGNAGTTNTGAIDPLVELAHYCRAQDLWFHVDAAYGGFAALCPEGRRRLAGMELADSLTLDPHKWLFAPLGVGCLLVRDRARLEAAFRSGGDYLRDLPVGEVDFLKRGPEMSRPARVLPVWVLLRTVGLDALAAQMEADLELARYVEARLDASKHFEVVTPAILSIVCFRSAMRRGESEAERSARDDRLIAAALRDGRVMLSSTLLDGQNALRFVVMNHRTDQREVDFTLKVLEELVRGV